MGCGAAATRYGSKTLRQEGPETRSAHSPWLAPVQPGLTRPLKDGEWQFEVAREMWCAFAPDISAQLLEAFNNDESAVSYQIGQTCYEADLQKRVQKERITGKCERIRWVPKFAACAPTIVVHDINTADETSHDPVCVGGALVVGHPGTKYDMVYQWQLKNGAWVDYEDEEQNGFFAAYASGKNVTRFCACGFEYEVDFSKMQQINLATGQVRQMQVKKREEVVGDSDLCMASDEAAEVGEGAECGMGSASEVGDQIEGPDASSEYSYRRPKPGYSRKARPEPARHGKKFSLDSRAQLPGAAARHRAAKAAAKAAATSAGAGPLPGPCPGPAEQNKASGGDAWQQLPHGVQWPAGRMASKAAEKLFDDLAGAGRAERPLRDRRTTYRAACLHWHPDKNPENEDLATDVFQFLQALRHWYLAP